MGKNDIFVAHVEQHLKELGLKDVVCKICNKTIDEIYKENAFMYCLECKKSTLFNMVDGGDKRRWICSECKQEFH